MLMSHSRIIMGVGVAALFLVGCGQKADGTYQAHYRSAGWFTDSVKTFKFRIDGGDGVLISNGDGSVPINVAITYDGDRLVAKDGQGAQISFRIKDRASTLDCPQCTSVNLPSTWEKESRGTEDRIAICNKAFERTRLNSMSYAMKTTGAPKEVAEATGKTFHEQFVSRNFRKCVFQQASYAKFNCLSEANKWEEANECARKYPE